MISAHNLTKRYGPTLAVDDLSFEVSPGVVTGFLGPNGSGKSTTMRMIVGLDRPDSGEVRVAGQLHRDLHYPLREVGALLEAKAIAPGRSARSHLVALARSNAIAPSRVDEVLDLVGLTAVATKPAGKFSLGMGQRLGIATALLGDPAVVLFDEPMNGLDPEGILWIRNLLSSLAQEGRTVFVSSHLMSEMALVATDVVVIGRGRLIQQAPIDEFIRSNATSSVVIKSHDQSSLSSLLTAQSIAYSTLPDGSFSVTGLPASDLGVLANDARIPLIELHETTPSLEDVFMDLTATDVVYQARKTTP